MTNMELAKDKKLKLIKSFKKTLENYVEYKDATHWKNNRGYISKDNINNIVYWLIYNVEKMC